MLEVTTTQLSAWINQYWWPFVRIAACLMVAPVFGARATPRRVRLVLAGALTVLVAPLISVPTGIELFSAPGMFITVQQLLIGIAMGFAVQIVFDALVMGGQLLANSMGLSFAMNVDPLHGVSTPVLGQLYMIIATLTFLVLNGHLAMIESLIQSFTLLPVAQAGLGRDGIWMLVNFGGTVFSGALLVALPGMAAALIVNFGFGVMSRAAPSINMFSVGFPAILALGLFILLWAIPGGQSNFIRMVKSVWLLLASMLTAGGA